MTMVSMSKQEFSRLNVWLRVQSGRLRVDDDRALIGLKRRQVFRLLTDLKAQRAWSPSDVSNRAIIGVRPKLAPSRYRSCASAMPILV